ncbi:hypothetical protein WKI68_34520 [Streptomyces sp. MS1.HAVA.3]|uniref:Uncharacterized protein n=1 Tax=Streptomyces caledonius TaxID=3134107 RepID=A0ABU8UAQ1_9ACTN
MLEALRGAGVGVPLSVSASIGTEPDPAGRLERVRSWMVLPDRAVVHFAEPGAGELAEVLLARGVAVDAMVPLGGPAGPEPLARFLAWPVRDPGRVRLAAELATADPALVAGLRGLPPVAVLLYGRDAAAWPVLRLAARCGTGTRTGAGTCCTCRTGGRRGRTPNWWPRPGNWLRRGRRADPASSRTIRRDRA